MRPFHSPRLLRALAIVALVCAFATPGIALAADVNPFWKSGSVSITNLAPGKTPTYIVTLVLDDTVKLPTSVPIAVPIPNGVKANWAGEIMGQSSADITAMDAEFLDSGGHHYITFTMTKSRIAQVECTPAPGMVSKDRKKINLWWTAANTLGPVLFEVQPPKGQKAGSHSKSVTAIKQQGTTLYVRKYGSLTNGQTGAMKLTLVGKAVPAPKAPATPADTSTAQPPAQQPEPALPAPATPAAPNSVPTVVIVLIALLLIAVIAVVVIILQQQMRGRRRDE